MKNSLFLALLFLCGIPLASCQLGARAFVVITILVVSIARADVPAVSRPNTEPASTQTSSHGRFGDVVSGIRFFSPTSAIAVTNLGVLRTDGSLDQWKGDAAWDKRYDWFELLGGSEKAIYLRTTQHRQAIVKKGWDRPRGMEHDIEIQNITIHGVEYLARDEATYIVWRWTPAAGLSQIRELPKSNSDPRVPAACIFTSDQVGAFCNDESLMVTVDGGKTWVDNHVKFIDEIGARWMTVLQAASDHQITVCIDSQWLALMTIDERGHLHQRWRVKVFGAGDYGEIWATISDPFKKVVWVYARSSSGQASLLHGLRIDDGADICDLNPFDLFKDESFIGASVAKDRLYTWGSTNGTPPLRIWDTSGDKAVLLDSVRVYRNAAGLSGAYGVPGNSDTWLLIGNCQLIRWNGQQVLMGNPRDWPGPEIDAHLLEEAKSGWPPDVIPSTQEVREIEEADAAADKPQIPVQAPKTEPKLIHLAVNPDDSMKPGGATKIAVAPGDDFTLVATVTQGGDPATGILVSFSGLQVSCMSHLDGSAPRTTHLSTPGTYTVTAGAPDFTESNPVTITITGSSPATPPTSLPAKSAAPPAAPDPNAPKYVEWKSFKRLFPSQDVADQRFSQSLQPPLLREGRLLIAAWGSSEEMGRPLLTLLGIDPVSAKATNLSQMPMDQDPLGTAALFWNQTYVLASLRRGIILLPTDGQSHARQITNRDGLPSNCVRAADLLGDTLYLAMGDGIGEPDQSGYLLAWNMKLGARALLAETHLKSPDNSERAEGAREAIHPATKHLSSPFDGGPPIQTHGLVADNERERIYFSASIHDSTLGGLWEFNPAENTFTHCLSMGGKGALNNLHVDRLWLVGTGRVLARLAGDRGLFLFDMATKSGQWLAQGPGVREQGFHLPLSANPLMDARIASDLANGHIRGMSAMAPPMAGWVWHVGRLRRLSPGADGRINETPMATGWLGRIKIDDLQEQFFSVDALTLTGTYEQDGLDYFQAAPNDDLILGNHHRMFCATPP